MYENDFQANMAAGRANAKRDRDRGGSTVTVYATTAAMYAARGELETYEAESRCRFDHAIAQFIEDVRFDVYGDEWSIDGEDFR